MATNDISKHFKTVKKLDNGGSQKDLIVSDSQFASYASDTIVENVNSGQQYSKNASFTNVYDKISSLNDYLLPTALSVAINGAIGNAITSLSYTSTSGKGQFNYTMDDFIKNAEFKTSTSNTLADDYGISTLTWNTETKTLNGNRTKYVQPSKVNVTTSGSGNAVTTGQWKQNSDGTYSVDLVKGESFSKPSNTKIAYSGRGNAITGATWTANSDGTSTLTFNKGETFLRLSDNATSATKASQNASGYALTNTIVKSIAISDRTITVTKIDGTSYTLTMPDIASSVVNNLANSFGSTAVGGIRTVRFTDNSHNEVPAGTRVAGSELVTVDNPYIRLTGTWKVTDRLYNLLVSSGSTPHMSRNTVLAIRIA